VAMRPAAAGPARRVLLSAGGTAGHVLPALSVLRSLTAASARPTPPSSDAASGATSTATGASAGAMLRLKQGVSPVWHGLFVGSVDGMEHTLVAREGIPFQAIHAGGIAGVGAAQFLRSAVKLFRGLISAWGIVRSFKPHVVLLTGGFVGVPIALAAWLRRVPSVVYLPDVEPGLAVKAMNLFATKVAATTEASGMYVPQRKLVVTGYPVRDAFATVTRNAARQRLGLSTDETVLLVFGGSKGARSINRAVLRALPALLQRATVIHVSGSADWPEVQAAHTALDDTSRARYRAAEYLHEGMVDALAAADLGVCRAGASTLGELPAVGLPAVLVPYPYAWRYQKVNAEYLAQRGAALVLEDARLDDDAHGLAASVNAVLDDPARLARMRQSMQAIRTHDGAQRIAALVSEVALNG
jgi:UDP-N-acetylglucosamine--N-acetylmuramyl-(pentapeptide) pyrophosphoryl-undecaprenol N-acetylglucosamine transferase